MSAATGPSRPDPKRLQTSPARWPAWAPGVMLLTLCLTAAIWGAVVYMHRTDREQVLESSRAVMLNYARMVAEHSRRTIEGADQAGRLVRWWHAANGRPADLSVLVREQPLFDPLYRLASVIDRQGMLAATSRPFVPTDLSDREHFRVHAEQRPVPDRVFVSRPVLGRVSQQWTLQVSRPILSESGAFDGVVVVSVEADYFDRFYRSIRLAGGGEVLLVGDDNGVRAGSAGARERSDPDPRLLAAARTDAARQARTAGGANGVIDHDNSLLAYAELPDQGLWALVVSPMSGLLSRPQARLTRMRWTASGATLALWLFVFLLLRQQRQRDAIAAELQSAQAEALRSQQAATRFLSQASHELRTPLNGVLGAVQMLAESPQHDAAEQRELAAMALGNARRLTRQVNAMIQFSRIDEGLARADFTHVALPALLQQLAAQFGPEAREWGMRLELDVSACPPLVSSDGPKLTQLLTIFLDNALRHSGGSRVTLSAHEGEAGPVVVIEDDGRGLGPAAMGRLGDAAAGSPLDAAARLAGRDALAAGGEPGGAEPARRDAEGGEGHGMGLGWPLAHRIAELIGCVVHLSPGPGPAVPGGRRGTRVTVEFARRLGADLHPERTGPGVA